MNKNNKKNQIKVPEKLTKVDLFFTHYFVIGIAFVLILGLAGILKYTYEKVSGINQNTTEQDVVTMADTIMNFRGFYNKTILPPAKEHGMVITHDYKQEEGALPLPATFVKEFGKYITPKDSKFSVTLYSDLPFSWRKLKKLDAFQQSALAALRKNPNKPIWSVETINGQELIRYARADVMKESCIECHNHYTGTPKTDWKAGDVRGVLEVTRPLGTFLADTQVALKNAFLMMLAIILSIISLLFVVIRKMSRSINLAHRSYQASNRDNKKLTTEIRQRKRITAALRANQMKTRAIVNSVGEVIVVINKKGIVMECNEAVKKIFGYQALEVVGQNISMLMTQEHAPHHDGYLEKYMKTGEMNIMGKRRQLFAKRRNGEVFPIELSVNDTRVGNEIIFTGTIRDITHRRRTEEATAAAHKAAIDSAKLKADFLANMSHEIRTPMNGVLGMTQVLLESDLDREQRGLAETVKDSAESLLVIINDVLDFSKIEAGKLSIKNMHFSLLPMIEGVIDLVDQAADKKFIEIAFFVDSNVPEKINSDSGRLRQILINLLNNALKFTDHGHVTLHVGMQESDQLHFEVIDTGLGIPQGQQATLFDSFSQVDSSSTREYGGTGLGLAICKQLVELMGGRIGVQSNPGSGSNFWFNIKIDPAEKGASTNHIRHRYIQADMSVLMLCTAHLLHRYYKQQMQQWGMRPSLVSSLNQLVRELDSHRFDLLLIDADNIFYDAEHPMGVLAFLKTLRGKTSAPIVLGAKKEQYVQLEQLQLGLNVRLIQKPIKHTAIKYLISKPHHKHSRSSFSTEASSDKAGKVEYRETSNKAGLGNSKHQILIAEDNRVNQKVATVILGKLGYAVTLVCNGKEALDAVGREIYDLVLMDCQMPEMDGYQASTQIRKLPETHHSNNIPIIAFTAHAMKEDADKCKQAGMDDYITKPVRMEELKAMLDRWSNEMKKRQALRTHAKTKETEMAVS